MAICDALTILQSRISCLDAYITVRNQVLLLMHAWQAAVLDPADAKRRRYDNQTIPRHTPTRLANTSPVPSSSF